MTNSDLRTRLLHDEYAHIIGWMLLSEVEEMWEEWSDKFAAGWLNPSDEDEVRLAAKSWLETHPERIWIGYNKLI
jgi:hypothetical protein